MSASKQTLLLLLVLSTLLLCCAGNNWDKSRSQDRSRSHGHGHGHSHSRSDSRSNFAGANYETVDVDKTFVTAFLIAVTGPFGCEALNVPCDPSDGVNTFASSRPGGQSSRLGKPTARTSEGKRGWHDDEIPFPTAEPLEIRQGNNFGFDAITEFQQAFGGTGVYKNTNFDVEPPDAALAINDDFIFVSVNNGVRIYSRKTGTPLTPVITSNQFFGLFPAAIFSTPEVFGPSLADPTALFDHQSRRWFLTLFQFELDPRNGTTTGRTSILIAVSESEDPVNSRWRIYKIPTQNDGTQGTPSHSGCPCFPDFPHTATDQHALYISVNEFSLDTNFFLQPNIYAVSKRLLALRSNTPYTSFPVTLFHDFPLDDISAFTVLPARVPPGGEFASSCEFGDIEYFVSSLMPDDPVSNKLAIWALTNTESLGTLNPLCNNRALLRRAFVKTQPFADPIPAVQKNGSFPLGQSLGSPLLLLDTSDKRINEPMFADGKLWAALNTGINDVSGIAYFIVSPTSGKQFGKCSNLRGAKLATGGYLTVNNTYLMYPAFGVNKDGRAIIGFSFSGEEWFPSVGYVRLDKHGRVAGDVKVVATGAFPEDGFSGYPQFGGNGVARWGDYSHAEVTKEGSIWFMTEYIPDLPRTEFANWGTFVARVHVEW